MPAMPNLPFQPSDQTCKRLIDFCRSTIEATNNQLNLRSKFEYIDREFYRKNMLTEEHQKARMQHRLGKKIVVSDVCMPIIEPQIETSLAFLTSVFLTGQPIFGIVAPPDKIDQAKKFEAIEAENETRGGWAAQIMMALRDGLKYNYMAMEIDWKRETIYSPIQEIRPGRQNGTQNKEMVWEGNCLRRHDPYNTLFDARVPLHEQHKYAEFVGYTELMSRIKLKQFIQDLPVRINTVAAFNSQTPTTSYYYIPRINDLTNFSLDKLSGIMNWDAWASGGTEKDRAFGYKGMYIVTTRYIRIIPREFDMPVPNRGMPQIWKVITVNDQVVILFERQTNAHNFLPMVFGQPYNDGLSLQSEGLGEKLIPLQDLASTSWNARLASQRRKISDRGLYDPSRVRAEDINSDNPSAKIPVKPSVYGKNVQEAYHAIPFEDNQSGSYVQDAKEFANMSNTISGQNQAQQGQFVKVNKTKDEYDDVQNKSSGRQRTQAIFIENQFFTPIKSIMMLNLLQYQPDGEITNPQNGQVYNVNKEELRKAALSYRVSDGLMPSEKLVSTPTLQVALQAIAQPNSPLQQEYDMGKLFSYLMSIEGADLTPFQLTPQQKMDKQAQQIRATATEAGATNAAVEATNRPEPPKKGA